MPKGCAGLFWQCSGGLTSPIHPLHHHPQTQGLSLAQILPQCQPLLPVPCPALSPLFPPPGATCTQGWSSVLSATVAIRFRHPMPASLSATWSARVNGAAPVVGPTVSPSTAWSWPRNLPDAVSPHSLKMEIQLGGQILVSPLACVTGGCKAL